MDPQPLYDWPKLCRICLKSDLVVSIFSSTFLVRPVDIVEKLNIFKMDENLPVNQLCQSCLYRLLDAYNLQQMAEASDRRLREFFNIGIAVDRSNSELNVSNLQTSKDDHFILKPVVIGSSDYDNFCDIFEQNVQSNDIEVVADDVLNDVEIDVSSLTRSEADDSLSEVFVENLNVNKSNYKGIEGNVSSSSASSSEKIVADVYKTPDKIVKTAKNGRKRNRQTVEHLCADCGKRFKYLRYLEAHRRIHTGEKPFKCKICERCFTYSNNLILHQRTHTGERHYQCEICSSLFTTSSNLKQHMLIHIDKRTIQCNLCERTFKSTRELRRHQPIHKAIKDIVCSICQKAFTKRSYLTVHIAAVHRCIRRHKCSDCSKTFSNRSNLVCHIRTHTGEKPYQCSHCSWKFSQSSALMRHLKKHVKSDSSSMSRTQQDSLQNSIINNLINSTNLVDTNDSLISSLDSQPLNYNLAGIGTMEDMQVHESPINEAEPTFDYQKNGILDYSINQQNQTHTLY